MPEQIDIPILDFSSVSLDVAEEDIDPAKLQDLADQVYKALSQVGFMYIKNHGFDMKVIDQLIQTGREMVSLPEEIKQKFAVGNPIDVYGWTNGREILNWISRPEDLKEVINYTKFADSWNEYVPTMEDAFGSFLENGMTMARRVLQTMAVSLKVDRYYFDKYFQELDSINCRYIKYPKPTGPMKENQVWCGEHTDFGALTLLFQTHQGGGLQVMRKDGVYVDAPPIDGAIVINVGDLMMRWSGDQFKSTRHRVLKPTEETGYTNESRESIAWFGTPDRDTLVECLDGSNKYPARTSREHQVERFAQIF